MATKPAKEALLGPEKLDESFQENVRIEMSDITEKHSATEGPDETT